MADNPRVTAESHTIDADAGKANQSA